MTRDELIDKITTALFETRHSKSDWNLLDLSLAALTAIETQGLEVVPVVASAELAEKAFPIPPKAHRNACVVRLHEHANKMRREDYDAMIQAGRL